MTIDHAFYMSEAIKHAKKNNPVWPFAAILIDQKGNIVAKAANEAHLNPLLHAETAVIIKYVEAYKNNLEDLILFTTAESCPMCQSAIYWAGIKTIYYGTTIPFLHSLWPNQIDIRAKTIIEQSPDHYKSNTKLIGPILEEECNALFLEGKRLQTNEYVNTEFKLPT